MRLVERRLDLVDRALHFARVRRLAPQPLELLVDRPSAVSATVWPRPRGRDDLERAAERARLLERRDVLRDLHVVDEPLVEPRVLAAGEHRRQRRRAPRRRARRRAASASEVQPRQPHLVGQRLPLDAGQDRGRRRDRLDRRRRAESRRTTSRPARASGRSRCRRRSPGWRCSARSTS